MFTTFVRIKVRYKNFFNFRKRSNFFASSQLVIYLLQRNNNGRTVYGKNSTVKPALLTYTSQDAHRLCFMLGCYRYLPL